MGTSGVEQARAAFGARLREIRKAAQLTGVQLATAAGWHSAKVSRIEHGKQTPSDSDIAIWCRLCDAELLLPDLRAALANVDALWQEWRRVAATGHAHQQRRRVELEARAKTIRNYEPAAIPGLLQTEPYARAILSTCIDFVGGVDDIDRAVQARLARQQILHHGIHRVTVLLGEQALYTTVGDDQVMRTQLEHLLGVMALPRLSLGIIARTAHFIYTTTCFVLLDTRMAEIETISAGLTITQPRELAYYEKTWSRLHQQASYGSQARALITAALEQRGTSHLQ
ncbi:helix-turn-helix transcriptional regulator [Nocardia sp. NBC_00508]|uniref:helix-turn-helix domain-containing protein n=1 Tax=Nocardia sp. NBC_00508 TaxID=2975992 RepID=UPI002E801562|nr:helix-turn-helix transcriptional regulator [Nocardia sp. NBC_00508]WUD67980.1 helix-turn-helix transcriptional regulator [Nocardia sp. NBC_00508]